jgi:23S rRNA-/tRNA-specific pseudouridylate synthase
MKSNTLLKKILKQIRENNEQLCTLMEEYQNAVQKESLKIKDELITKIATSYSLDIDILKKKFLKKKKIVEEYDNSEIENDESPDMITNNIPIYKKIIYEDEEYYYDDKPNGIVLKKTDTSSKIVGYINNNIINFM